MKRKVIMSNITHISAKGAPKPIAPFSHACEAGRFVFLTGQMPIDPQTNTIIGDDIEGQTVAVLNNLVAVLNQAELGLQNVVSARAFLTDMTDYENFNRVYEAYFHGYELPARTCIGVVALALGAKVEIDFVAYRAD